MIWSHLDLQTQLQIQMNFRGLSAKLHCMHFEKGSNGKSTITMQFLGRNYPKIIYGMAIFEFGKTLTKTKEMEGLIAKWPHSNYLEGQNAKRDLTIMISGSSYPKNIYGMAIFEFGKTLTKTKEMEGLIAKWPHLEGQNAKRDPTMMISGSNYPKNIYGMPLVELEVQKRFEF